MLKVNHAIKFVGSCSGYFGFLPRIRFFSLADLSRQPRDPLENGIDEPKEREYYEAGGLNEAFIMERWCSFQPRD